MDIYEVIEKRRSVRIFREDPIPTESMDKILNAVRLAPSAHNAQEYRIIIVKDAETKKALAEAASSQRFIATAPAIIVGVATKPKDEMAQGVPGYSLDIAIALDHLSLVAAEEDLGTCWIGAFNQKEVKDILGIPEDCMVAALMALGIPYDEPTVKSRKAIKQIFCEERFSMPE